MIRSFALVILVIASMTSAQVLAPARAPTLPPTPPPAPTSRPFTPATKPSPAELHAQAYDFMRQEKFDKATPLLNRAYNETPAAQRSRPLVLNRALLDLVQKGNLPRAMKDLYQYFARNPAPDEEASDLLGSILEMAAQNQRWRDGPLYADAFREFARRETVLERHRPGFKRWGPKWITQGEFDEIQRKDREVQQQIYDQYQRVDRATTTMRSLAQQYNTAATKARGFANHSHVRRVGDPIVPCPICAAMYEATQSATELSAELDAANKELDRENKIYEQLQRRTTKPTWPTRYDPIDPDAPPPKPPEHPAIAAALAATQPVDDLQAPTGQPAAPGAGAVRQPVPQYKLPPATRPSDLVR